VIFTITEFRTITLIVAHYEVCLTLTLKFDTSLSLSKEISLVNLTNILKCFLIKVSLLIGQTSVCNTVDIKLSLSLFSSSHSYEGHLESKELLPLKNIY
jgi:presenilin-like A22 family membrane protease